MRLLGVLVVQVSAGRHDGLLVRVLAVRHDGVLVRVLSGRQAGVRVRVPAGVYFTVFIDADWLLTVTVNVPQALCRASFLSACYFCS